MTTTVSTDLCDDLGLPRPLAMPDWWHHAACIDIDVDVFFDTDTEQARQVCAGCPVADLCAASAFVEEVESATHTFGVRAGMTAEERSEVMRVWLQERGIHRRRRGRSA